MGEQSAFDQVKVAEKAYVEPSGVLDQLNLPPGFIRFVRNNKRALQVAAVTLTVVVVSGSLYQSYHSRRLEDAASSLALSMEGDGESKKKALGHVASEYEGTPSALWATVELGHLAMKDGLYREAGQYYSGVRAKIDASNPLYGLLTYGMAQAGEAAGDYEGSSASYTVLKEIDGYKNQGYMGDARVLEAGGKRQEALGVYEEYLGTILGEQKSQQLGQMIEEKMNRLRVTK